MRCPRKGCEGYVCGGYIIEDRDEDNKLTRALKLGKVFYCVNCGWRGYERIAALPVRLAIHDPRHRSLGI